MQMNKAMNEENNVVKQMNQAQKMSSWMDSLSYSSWEASPPEKVHLRWLKSEHSLRHVQIPVFLEAHWIEKAGRKGNEERQSRIEKKMILLKASQ